MILDGSCQVNIYIYILDDHPRKMKNMKCWLKHYNLLDVQPLALAMEKSFDCFHEYFEQDANMHQSLPAIAEASMYRHYNQDCSHIYSFQPKDDDVRKLHRDTIVGGLVNVFHRHIYLGVSSNINTYIYIYIHIIF